MQTLCLIHKIGNITLQLNCLAGVYIFTLGLNVTCRSIFPLHEGSELERHWWRWTVLVRLLRGRPWWRCLDVYIGCKVVYLLWARGEIIWS